MNLPFFHRPTRPTSSPREYLFALQIDPDHVSSAVWTVANDKIQVISLGKLALWQDSTPDSLLEACDQTLTDSAFQVDRTGKIQPDKVILGLPSNWVTSDKINPDKLKLLKHITKQLSLTAVGFVVTPQAVIRYLHETEGVPPTAIIVGLSRTTMEVTLSHLGKTLPHQIVSRSSNLVSDLIEGLSRFLPQDMLPSRVLLYDSGSSLEEAKQLLLAHPWQAPQTRLPFLHFPKIEVLPPDFPIRAISLAGGVEVAQSIGLMSTSSSPIPPAASTNSSDLGFFPDIDIANQSAAPLSAPVEPTRPSLPKIALPHFSFPKFTFRLPKIAALLSLLAVLCAGGVYFYWYFPQAEIQIILVPQNLTTQFDIQVDAAASSPNITTNLIPATIVEAQVSGKRTRDTTGAKIVGDKATGEVVVLNGTSSPRSFPAGTTLTSPSGLKYIFDSPIDVASASGTADPNSYQPGRSKVSVTAQSIGSEYNLSAGTQFRLGSFSSLDYVAKNDAALAGGSSRQVQVVSSQDLTALKSDLTTSLKEEAITKLKNDLPTDKRLVDSSITTTGVSEKFSHAVDSETDEVVLESIIKASALSFATQDVDQLVTANLATKIPTGFHFDRELSRSFQVLSQKGTKAQITLQVASRLVPDLNLTQVATDIQGKTLTVAESYLKQLPQVSDAKISLRSLFPAAWVGIPRLLNHISLTTKVVE
jgi:hypothetical protein